MQARPPKPPQDLLAQAVRLHQRGLLAEAIPAYRRFLRQAPGHAGALNLLGLACFQHGEAEQGAASVAAALKLDPRLPGAAYNLGLIQQALGRHREAAAAYERALTIAPNDVEALNNLGIVLKFLNRPQEAIASYRRALALKPDYAEAHYNLANILLAAGSREETISHYRRAIELNPRRAEAHINLGNALRELGRTEQAVAHYRNAAALDPTLDQAHQQLGETLAELEQHEEAAASQARALALLQARSAAPPILAAAHFRLAHALQALGRHQDAASSYQSAVALDPQRADAHVQLGNSLLALKREDDALRHFEQAKRIDPALPVDVNIAHVLHGRGRSEEAERLLDATLARHPGHAAARWFRSALLLSLGRLTEGWRDHDAHWAAAPEKHPGGYSQPPWDGGAVPEVLLLWGDQGLGDQILYASVLPDLAEHAEHLVLEVEPRLVALFARSFPEFEVGSLGSERAGGRVDAQAPLSDLPKLLRPSLEAFPRRTEGYLRADPARAQALRARLAGDGRAVVGLSWISRSPTRATKSAELRDLAPLLALRDCRFVDLQYGDTRAEREAVERELGVRVERLDDIDTTQDIDGLAALMQACDAVVSVSNTNAHLAGALGRPTWVMVPHGFAHIWYWFKEGAESPWYPRVRVWRQGASEPWRDLATSIAREVEHSLTERAR